MVKSGRRRKPRVTVSQLPWRGDHGTCAPAAMRDTELVPIDGDNPNRIARRQRVDRIKALMDRGSLTMRQYQAARAIQNAYAKVEMLSSGGELKEWIQSAPKPDAVVARQVDANSALTHVMRPVLHSERGVVEHVCWGNQPLRTSGIVRASARLKTALTRVADHMRY